MKALSQLREALRLGSYTRGGLHGLGAFRGVPIDRTAAIAATAGRSPFDILARLFFLRVPVGREVAQSALGPASVNELVGVGVLERDSEAGGDAVVGGCAIIPIGELFTLRDFEPGESGRGLAPDHVLGVGKATSILSALTVRRQVERALDIGTGQGFQALVAAGTHAKHVIATDITDRSLLMAGWACELNGITNITLLKGGLFDPVEGQAPFDLIISNPPFIIAPPHDLVCLGGSHRADSLVQELIAGLPERLTPGGYACIMCNWHHEGEGEAGHGAGGGPAPTWSSRPRSWLPRGAGCDGWLIELRRETSREYIDGWMSEADFEAREGRGFTARAWDEYLQSINAAYISLGCFIIRKRAGETSIAGNPTPNRWFRADSLNMEDCDGEASDQIQRIFENQTLLSNISDVTHLATLPLGLAPTHVLAQQRVGTGGRGWQVERSTLRQTKGFDFEIAVDAHAAELLSFFDGMTPCGEIIRVMAKRLRVDPQHAVEASGPFLARLLALGHLYIGDESVRAAT